VEASRVEVEIRVVGVQVEIGKNAHIMQVKFVQVIEANQPKCIVYLNGQQIGAKLTDNAYEDDGYRFHDIFHLSYLTILGWSPVVDSMLGIKTNIEKNEDRAQMREEIISFIVFNHAQRIKFFKKRKKEKK
jgi:hypothetical protein